ncbi:MAG: hypothetical protein BWK76_08145 [Desulfobulbaceae bacterium A2]|nr:MAG: hypothetical protein BWK76_08145 [Desulfobulbaceae bacterium A2]
MQSCRGRLEHNPFLSNDTAWNDIVAARQQCLTSLTNLAAPTARGILRRTLARTARQQLADLRDGFHQLVERELQWLRSQDTLLAQHPQRFASAHAATRQQVLGPFIALLTQAWSTRRFFVMLPRTLPAPIFSHTQRINAILDLIADTVRLINVLHWLSVTLEQYRNRIVDSRKNIETLRLRCHRCDEHLANILSELDIAAEHTRKNTTINALLLQPDKLRFCDGSPASSATSSPQSFEAPKPPALVQLADRLITWASATRTLPTGHSPGEADALSVFLPSQFQQQPAWAVIAEMARVAGEQIPRPQTSADPQEYVNVSWDIHPQPLKSDPRWREWKRRALLGTQKKLGHDILAYTLPAGTNHRRAAAWIIDHGCRHNFFLAGDDQRIRLRDDAFGQMDDIFHPVFFQRSVGWTQTELQRKAPVVPRSLAGWLDWVAKTLLTDLPSQLVRSLSADAMFQWLTAQQAWQRNDLIHPYYGCLSGGRPYFLLCDSLDEQCFLLFRPTGSHSQRTARQFPRQWLGNYLADPRHIAVLQETYRIFADFCVQQDIDPRACAFPGEVGGHA